MARLFFMALESSGQTHVIKKLRAAGHKIALTEPRYPGFYDLLKQQSPAPDAIIVDCSQKVSHAIESCNYIRSLKAHKETPLLMYNVKAEDEARIRERVPSPVLVRDDKVEKALLDSGIKPATAPA